jgi:SAM-dependent methyltransferase
LRQVRPYTALASIYDRVMDHVDYEEWAGYVDTLLALHAPAATDLLELGCGTGRMAAELARLRTFRLTATDGSADMLEHARERLEAAGIEARYRMLDFTDDDERGSSSGANAYAASVPTPAEAFDAVLLLYDGFNYARTLVDAAGIFRIAGRLLKPGGVFIFDQVTPANSINNDRFFEDGGTVGPVRYLRWSEYEADRRIHRTIFEIRSIEGAFREEHEQRIWTRGEVRGLIRASPLEIEAAYDDHTLDPADEESERIHWVVSRPRRDG